MSFDVGKHGHDKIKVVWIINCLWSSLMSVLPNEGDNDWIAVLKYDTVWFIQMMIRIFVKKKSSVSDVFYKASKYFNYNLK